MKAKPDLGMIKEMCTVVHITFIVYILKESWKKLEDVNHNARG